MFGGRLFKTFDKAEIGRCDSESEEEACRIEEVSNRRSGDSESGGGDVEQVVG